MAQREGEIREQMKALKAELKELQVAKAALGGEAAAPPAKTGGQTIKDMARAVLDTAAGGMTAHEILAAIKEEFDREIDRTSLSPQLSRLKTDGVITLHDDRWFTQARFDAYVRNMFNDYGDFASSPSQSHVPEEDDSDSVPF
jgi:hypothetical protein